MSDTSEKEKQLEDSLKRKNSGTYQGNLDETYIAIPGTIVRVLLEFPNYKSTSFSGIIELDDVSTLSYSLYRVKIPVIPLGQMVQDGFGIGTRAVAGTMIRSIFMKDHLSDLQTKMYLANQEDIRKRLENLDGRVPDGIPNKDQISFMKDDLSTFNIHVVSVSEVNRNYATGIPYLRQEMILGCTILNNGQTYSVEDLITESSFTFQAKAVRTSSDPSQYNRGFGSSQTEASISSLLKKG